MLQGQRLRLRPLQAVDVHLLLRWDDDTEVNALIGKKFDSQESAAEWYSRLTHRADSLVLGIEVGGHLIGDMELEHISWRAKTAELSICIGEREYWGRGYGAEAIGLLLDFCFGSLGLRRVYLRVYRHNLRAIKCYEKCGFRKEGVLRRSGRVGRKQGDVYLMAVEAHAAVLPRRAAGWSGTG